MSTFDFTSSIPPYRRLTAHVSRDELRPIPFVRPVTTMPVRPHPDTMEECRLVGVRRELRQQLENYRKIPLNALAHASGVALIEQHISEVETALREIGARNDARAEATLAAQEEAEAREEAANLTAIDAAQVEEMARRDAEARHWSAVVAQEATTEGRHHGPALTNPHD